MRFDDFTDTARRAVEEANATAIRDRHPQLTAELLLLVMIDQRDSDALRVLVYLGAPTATLRQALADEVQAFPKVAQDRMTIAPMLLRIFEQARANARADGSPATSTAHILGAISYVSGTRAQAALVHSGASPEAVARAARSIHRGEGGGRKPEAPAAGAATPGQSVTPSAPGPTGAAPGSVTAASAAPPVTPSAGYGGPAETVQGGTTTADSESVLAQFSVDLTQRAAKGLLDPVIGRDDELRRIMEILGRRRKNNPVLVGEPGVGKTAIVEGLAQRIAAGDVPDALRGKRLVALDLGSVLAGTKLRGDFEERMKKIVQEVTASAGQVILFIDELHALVGTGGGGGKGGIDAASLLKPALARGELHAIGATTTKEYRGSIEKDMALARRFQTVEIAETGFGESLSILRGLKERYEVHHGVQIGDQALVAAVRLSTRYVSDRMLPDKALDLLDEAASRLRLETDSLPGPIDEVRRRIMQLEVEGKALQKEGTPAALGQKDLVDKELARLRVEHEGELERWKRERDIMARIRQVKEELEFLNRGEEAATRAGNLNEAAEIRFGRTPAARRKLAALEGELAVVQKDGGYLREAVTADDIASVVSAWTGIPVRRLAEEESAKLLELEARLQKKVIGQDAAVTAVANVVRRSRSGIQNPGRPLGSFLFLGPTGVGKTYLVKCLAEILFDDANALVRIDMSEYMEKHAVARLVGAPPGYVGHEEGGQLTEAVRKRPYTIVLLDEVEKAHNEVFDLLLQVLDDGRLTDSMGRVVSFKNTLIVMTSNLGSEAIVELAEAPEAEMRKAVQVALDEFFRPEMLNRIDEQVIFRRLSREDIVRIVGLELAGLGKRLADQGLTMDVKADALDRIAVEGYDPAFGARPVNRAIRRLVEDPLSYALIAGTFRGAAGVEIAPDPANPTGPLAMKPIPKPAAAPASA
ncbi:MAG: AAA family ATPase [Deltaproteobacteria bacterium]|nr:AAA family ATPase [Deltaproteobacteria bacterium]